MHVQVLNPDDEFGSPAYDGPADQAHTRLIAGTYRAFTEDDEVRLVVGGATAQTWAEVNGSTNATVTYEHRDPETGRLVVDTVVTWDRDVSAT